MVEVVYLTKYYPEYDDKIEKALGSAHGYGMGGTSMNPQVRDLCWVFMDNKELANKFFKLAKAKLKGLKAKVELIKYDSANHLTMR